MKLLYRTRDYAFIISAMGKLCSRFFGKKAGTQPPDIAGTLVASN